jgi:predicted nicotinamide N-methyase
MISQVQEAIQRQVFCAAPASQVVFGDVPDEHLDAWQEGIYAIVLNHPHMQRYPTNPSNRIAFMKRLIRFLEERQAEVLSELYEFYLAEISQPASDSDDCFKTYFIEDEHWLTLKERRQVISSGTTGLSTWTAAYVLVDWISSRREVFAQRSILELGSGTGFVGLSAALMTQASSVVLTDCHPDVLHLLNDNVDINRVQSRVSVLELDWCSFSFPEIVPDFVLASDVVYDPSICLPLSQVLAAFASRGSRIYLALTVRNAETLQIFLDTLAQMALGAELIDEVSSPVGRLAACYTMIAPVRIFEVTRKTTHT